MRTSLCVAISAACALLAVGSQSAQAQTYDCSAMSPSYCSNAAYMNACSTPEKLSYCKTVLDGKLQQITTTNEKLYKTNQPKLFSNLVDGRSTRVQFKMPSRTAAEALLDAVSKQWTKVERKAREGAWVLPFASLTQAATYDRNLSWRAGGYLGVPVSVASCTEYVDELYHTYERFIDATNRCQRDAECIVGMIDKRFLPDGVAPTSLGGIRDMRSLWGDKPPGKITQLEKAILPKNAFTTEAAVGFLPNAVINLFPEHAAALQAKRDWMFQQRNRFGIGISAPQIVESFPTEVDYHLVMRNRAATSKVSRVERAKHRERSTQLSRSIRTFVQHYNSMITGGLYQWPVIRPYPRNEIPLDPVDDKLFLNYLGTQYPQTLSQLEFSDIDFFSANRAFVEKLASGVGIDQEIGNQTSAYPNAFYYPDVNNDPYIPGGAKGDIGGLVAQALQHYPLSRKANTTVPTLACPSDGAPRDNFGQPVWAPADEWERVAEEACHISNTILEEYAYAQATNGLASRSCLSPSFSGCDWSPEDFVDRFTEHQFVGKERQAALDRCEVLTRGFTVPDSFIPKDKDGKPVGSVTFGAAKQDGAKMVQLLSNAEAAINNRLKAVPRTSLTEPKFGEWVKQTDLLGDKDLFSVQYFLGAGWSADLIKVNNKACRMNASVGADADVSITVLGTEQSVIDAHALGSVKDGVGKADVYLKVLGGNMFTPIDETIDLNGITNPLVDESSSKKLIEVSVATAVGPVPVVITAGAKFSYGISGKIAAKAPTNCIPNESEASMATLMNVHSTFGPYAGFDAYASAAAGVPGLAEVELSINLNLLKVQLDAYTNVATGIDSVAGYDNVASINFDAGANLDISTLDGYVELEVTTLFVPWSVKLGEWTGLHNDIVLLKSPKLKVPMFALDGSYY